MHNRICCQITNRNIQRADKEELLFNHRAYLHVLIIIYQHIYVYLCIPHIQEKKMRGRD